jgi:NitT/TauT family transport system substrate-binding protein
MKVADGVEAAAAFKAGQCDVGIVWAPDDADCVAAVKGSKVLVSTATATQIIADGLLATADNIAAKHDKLSKLVAAWCEGNALINSSTTSRTEANNLFAKAFDFPADVAAISSTKIRFCTLADNINFFGLNATYTGVTGDKMYGRMAVKYVDAGLAKAPASWSQVSDNSIINELSQTPLAKDINQSDAPVATFTPPTDSVKHAKAEGTKQLTLNFDFNSATLSDANQTIIDREVTGIAEGFANARIRVEGNTDNVGKAAYNKTLSQARAQAVVDYLVREHKFDPNKFIVVGNGSAKPVCQEVDDAGCQAKNRRTDINFIW